MEGMKGCVKLRIKSESNSQKKKKKRKRWFLMEGMEGCAKFKIKMRRVVVISVPKFVLGNKKNKRWWLWFCFMAGRKKELVIGSCGAWFPCVLLFIGWREKVGYWHWKCGVRETALTTPLPKYINYLFWEKENREVLVTFVKEKVV